MVMSASNRYLIVSDTHENSRAFWRIIKEAEPYDAVFCAGDIEDHADMDVPFYFVAGNHCIDRAQDLLKSIDAGLVRLRNFIRVLPGKVYTHRGMRIAGLPGNYAPTDYDRPRRLLVHQRHFTRSEFESVLRLKGIDVLITHESPKGVADFDWRTGTRHLGVQPIRDLLDAVRPRFMICGHIHNQQIAEYQGTIVINGGYGVDGEYAVLNLSTGAVEFYKKFELVKSVDVRALAPKRSQTTEKLRAGKNK